MIEPLTKEEQLEREGEERMSEDWLNGLESYIIVTSGKKVWLKEI